MFCSKFKALAPALLMVLLVSPGFSKELEGGRVIHEKFHHLGDDIIGYWPEVPAEPEGTRLDVKFDSPENSSEWTLSLTYWDVNFPVAVTLNGRPLENLPSSHKRKLAYIAVPIKALRSGENVLSFVVNPTDDSV